MARRLVLCLDGTGSEIGGNISNVVKLFRILEKSDRQLVYYDPGVGTIGQPGWWSGLKLQVRAVFGLALGLGLDDNVLDAYSWLCRTWQEGDEVYLLGFSRGAYTARVLAGFIHLIGLLQPEQLNLCGYALVAYKRASDSHDFKVGSTFQRITGSRRIPIRFIGCWDTVASLITPRADRLYLPQLQTLLFTRTNPSVMTFRHAISIDEPRRMFRLNHWRDPQPFQPDPFDRSKDVPQDVRQVWFSGVHTDIGGAYPEAESGLSKYPLLWMIDQAEAAGLETHPTLKSHLAAGAPGGPHDHFDYVPPSPTAQLHQSLIGPWWLLEALPKYYTLKEWARRIVFLFFYFPWAEPRPIPNRVNPSDAPVGPAVVHSSVLARIAALPGYRPANLPASFDIEAVAGPPAPPIPPPPYRRPGLFARLRAAFTTMPAGAGWLTLAKEAAWLVPVIGLLGWWGGFLHWRPDFGHGALRLALLALLLPALAEESVFRAALVRPPPDGATAFGPAALSALLFTLWYPLQARLFHPWYALPCNWWFLIATAALGFACARLFLATRSIWPSVILHWVLVAAWALLLGPPAGWPIG